MTKKNIHEYSPKTQKILDINETMTQYFMNYLFSATPASKEAQTYLKKRNIHHKTIIAFKIGYCPDHETLLKFFTTQKYS